MKHIMRLNPIPFESIANGTKTVELRLYDEKRRKLRIGDVIEFVSTENGSRTVEVRVTDLLLFDSFDALYKSLPLSACGYAEDELDTASPEDMEQYYSKEKQAQYGVVGIQIALL